MRLLIPVFSPPTGTWGGLTRAIAVAEAATAAGHAVAFCAAGYLEEALRKHGYRVYPTPETTMFGLPKPISRVIERRSQHASPPVKPGTSVGSIWLVLLATGLASVRHTRRLVEAEIAAVRDFRADRLFTDLDLGAYLAAAITGLPLAATYAQIATHGSGTLPWRLAQRTINKVLQSYGKTPMTPDELCFNRSVLKIIPSIPELDDADADRADVCYVGRLLGPIHAARTPGFQLAQGKRYAFVYTGTGSVSLGTVQKILPQVFTEDSELDCVVGGQSIERPFRIGGVAFYPYVPADEVLPRCAWTICHGGQNTIIQSLYHDVPLLIFPGAIFERRYNALKVAQAGAGLMGEVDEFTVEWLRAALEHQADCANRAATLGERIRSYGGAAAAVEAISRWEGSDESAR
jgi:UDP:flavonoid glycosyltransferase YjiC (YdhE family)